MRADKDKPRDGIRTLIIVHGSVNTALGVSLLLWSNISAENILGRVFAYWFWPVMFIIAGVMAMFGLKSRILAQFSFAFAGIVMAVFGVASALAVIISHMFIAIPTTIFLFYLAYLKFTVATLIRQRDNIVDQIAEATEKGKTTLDRVTDGTDTATR